ncbi:ras GEF [Neolentinus lepideus HHB14362 ss-1]|uniref:Ras GEF n=1 Tax=Neolentinus lepideus HHB14362 ss-1 TaxID=1314782 RepID=A0A165VYR7_9AGAM|nr:ras GEF [Neolentinus lepideus HHB14362 ss-1]
MPSSSFGHGSTSRPDTPFPQNAFTASLSSNIIASGVPDISTLPREPLGLPSSLRKSVSVDSFMSAKQDIASDSQTRPARLGMNADQQEASPPPPYASGSRGGTNTIASGAPSVPLKKEVAVFPSKSSQGRDTNLGRCTDDESLVEESEEERSDSSFTLGESSRASSKGWTQSRVNTRPGELFLPSRLPPLVSDMGLSESDHISDFREDTISRNAMTRRCTTSVLNSSPSVRLRSGSLGTATSQRTDPSSFDSNDWNPNSSWPTISIAVVGTSHCGKSTFVEKGLKAYGLSKPIGCSVPLGDKGTFDYTFRTGRIPRPHSSHGRILGIMEVDVPARNLDHISTSSGPVWPGGAPDIQGVLICYDSSDDTSFQPIERLLREYRELKLPTVVVACKSDLERRVPTREGHSLASSFDTGIVEVSDIDGPGTEKMQRCFDWLLRAVFKEKRVIRSNLGGTYRNPASPDVLDSPIAWEPSRSNNATPTPASVAAHPFTLHSTGASKNPPSALYTPASPTRARSTSDLLYEREKQSNVESGQGKDDPSSMDSLDFQGEMGSRLSRVIGQDPTSAIGESAESLQDSREKEVPLPWATLEQLLDKLLFLAVSGDDPTFITHFLLTYRRFATPRSILLAMQKRMIQLTQSSADPIFAAFAQMRICHLLERWIRAYPGDFAVSGTHGAFSAVINSVLSKVYLLHYGSDFLPFRDELPTLVDEDAAWALKARDFVEGSDDSSSSHHGDDEFKAEVATTAKIATSSSDSPDIRKMPRERRPSLPITARSLVIETSALSVNSSQSDPSEMSQKQILKELQRMAHEVNSLESTHIAQEITRMEAKLFLGIEPRHWLQHVLVAGRKEPDTDSIAKFNQVSSHLADWVVSLVLCHDRPKARSKQIEKFVDIAYHLRRMNNYSALRAFVAGINNSTFQGDETMTIFKEKSEKHYKQLQSYDVLLQSIRSHRAYRMALRNTKGACIPALEVHISDLIRTQEGNPDVKPNDPSKIHWGKYNLMGRFISTIIQCQAQCRTSLDYDFPELSHISDLLLRDCLMDEGMQQSRIASVSDGGGTDDIYSGVPVKSSSREYPSSAKDPTLIKKIFFW